MQKSSPFGAIIRRIGQDGIAKAMTTAEIMLLMLT